MDESLLAGAEAFQEALIETARQSTSRKALPTEDLAPHQFKRLMCVDCEVDLPLYRMKKGLSRCTSCESDIEKAGKGIRKAM